MHQVKVTVEHAACDPVKKMYIWVRDMAVIGAKCDSGFGRGGLLLIVGDESTKTYKNR